MTTLCELFNKYKCDKGSLKHRYDRIYEPCLEVLKTKENISILEIGVFKGNSLEAFVDFMPEAKFVGIDIFVRVTPEKIKILNHDRVQWCRCDSLIDPTDEFKQMAIGNFDVIIDDGLHTHDGQRKTFDNFIPYLKDDGVYYIEDVWAFDYMTNEEKEHQWMKSHPNDYSEEQYQQLLNSISKYNTKFYDLRQGYDPDTFIIEVTK